MADDDPKRVYVVVKAVWGGDGMHREVRELVVTHGAKLTLGQAQRCCDALNRDFWGDYDPREYLADDEVAEHHAEQEAAVRDELGNHKVLDPRLVRRLANRLTWAHFVSVRRLPGPYVPLMLNVHDKSETPEETS